MGVLTSSFQTLWSRQAILWGFGPGGLSKPSPSLPSPGQRGREHKTRSHGRNKPDIEQDAWDQGRGGQPTLKGQKAHGKEALLSRDQAGPQALPYLCLPPPPLHSSFHQPLEDSGQWLGPPARVEVASHTACALWVLRAWTPQYSPCEHFFSSPGLCLRAWAFTDPTVPGTSRSASLTTHGHQGGTAVTSSKSGEARAPSRPSQSRLAWRPQGRPQSLGMHGASCIRLHVCMCHTLGACVRPGSGSSWEQQGADFVWRQHDARTPAHLNLLAPAAPQIPLHQGAALLRASLRCLRSHCSLRDYCFPFR